MCLRMGSPQSYGQDNGRRPLFLSKALGVSYGLAPSIRPNLCPNLRPKDKAGGLILGPNIRSKIRAWNRIKPNIRPNDKGPEAPYNWS